MGSLAPRQDGGSRPARHCEVLRDWPRGRIVFDRSRELFILYADRKLLTPATIARLETQFQLREERTEVQSDLHYKSTETPNGLGT
jgi:hypothetical protein